MSSNAHKNAVDELVEQRASFQARAAASDGHLWHAEFLLHRCAKLMPDLIAVQPYQSVARDTLCEEIREFLTEPRDHPAAGVVEDFAWPPRDVAMPGAGEGAGQGGDPS